tara:strand:+ start:165 stop:689 length:525 start_codon:yes stop_codon:yes gene_type:complete
MAKKKKGPTKHQKHTQSYIKTKKALEQGKVVTIDSNSVISVPIAGGFRDYISEVLNYLFTLKSEQETLSSLSHIREGFKNIPKDAPYDPYMNSIWTLMSLLSEINHQAAEQGHTIVTDEDHDETLSNIINSFEVGEEKHTKGTFKENRAAYKKKLEKAKNHLESIKKEDKTNED